MSSEEAREHIGGYTIANHFGIHDFAIPTPVDAAGEGVGYLLPTTCGKRGEHLKGAIKKCPLSRAGEGGFLVP